MISNNKILNEKPAAAIIRDGLNLISTTMLCPQERNHNDALIHGRRSRHK